MSQHPDTSVLRCCVCLTDDKEAVTSDILFYCFPPASMGKLLDRWLKALSFSGNKEVLDRLLICSKHFEASCFDEHRRLMDNSVPIIFEEDIPCLVPSSDDDQGASSVSTISPFIPDLSLTIADSFHPVLQEEMDPYPHIPKLIPIHETPASFFRHEDPYRREVNTPEDFGDEIVDEFLEDPMDPYPHIPKLIPIGETTSFAFDPRPWEVNTPDELVEWDPASILGDPDGRPVPLSLPQETDELADEGPEWNIVDGFVFCSFSTEEAMDGFKDDPPSFSDALNATRTTTKRKMSTSSSSSCTELLESDDDDLTVELEIPDDPVYDDDVVELPFQDHPTEIFDTRQEGAKDLEAFGDYVPDSLVAGQTLPEVPCAQQLYCRPLKRRARQSGDGSCPKRARHNTEELKEEARKSTVFVRLEDVYREIRSSSAIHRKALNPPQGCHRDSSLAENEALQDLPMMDTLIHPIVDDRNHLKRTRHSTEELTEKARKSKVSVLLEDVLKKKKRN